GRRRGQRARARLGSRSGLLALALQRRPGCPGHAGGPRLEGARSGRVADGRGSRGRLPPPAGVAAANSAARAARGPRRRRGARRSRQDEAPTIVTTLARPRPSVTGPDTMRTDTMQSDATKTGTIKDVVKEKYA